jgi:hypothetical protein
MFVGTALTTVAVRKALSGVVLIAHAVASTVCSCCLSASASASVSVTERTPAAPVLPDPHACCRKSGDGSGESSGDSRPPLAGTAKGGKHDHHHHHGPGGSSDCPQGCPKAQTAAPVATPTAERPVGLQPDWACPVGLAVAQPATVASAFLSRAAESRPPGLPAPDLGAMCHVFRV